jgi:YggT family protein
MSAVIFALEMLSYLIIGDAILSWIQPNPDRFPRKITSLLTEPLYKPIHMLINPQKTGGLDLAPLIVLVGIRLVVNALR